MSFFKLSSAVFDLIQTTNTENPVRTELTKSVGCEASLVKITLQPFAKSAGAVEYTEYGYDSKQSDDEV